MLCWKTREAIHLLSITAAWLLARAVDLPLTILDAAVLCIVVVAVALIPISIGGWGVRELTVTSLLGIYGVLLVLLAEPSARLSGNIES
jgi:glycosyltransferase 2 family protein